MEGVYFMTQLSRYAYHQFQSKDHLDSRPLQSKDDIKYWFMQYNFHAFVTLTLDNENLDVSSIDKLLIKWIRKVQLKEKMQMCYIAVITRHYGYSKKHIHLLMYGKNRNGKLLISCKPYNFKKYWGSFASFQIIYDYKGIVNYIIDKNIGYSFELLTPYNKKLLNFVSVNHKRNYQLYQ